MDYLQQYYPQMWEDYRNARQQMQVNPDYSVILLGGVCESIAKEVVARYGLQNDSTQFGRLTAMKNAQLLPERAEDTMHQIRLARNKVGHGDGHITDSEATQLVIRMDLVVRLFETLMTAPLPQQVPPSSAPAGKSGMDVEKGCALAGLFIMVSFALSIALGIIGWLVKPLAPLLWLIPTAAIIYFLVRYLKRRR